MKKILSIVITFLCTLGINAQIPLGGSTEENPVEIKKDVKKHLLFDIKEF